MPKLRYYRVESPEGYEGTFNIKDLILEYAKRENWKPLEVQRIVCLEPGESLRIWRLTITRSPKT